MRAAFGYGGWVGIDGLGLPGPLYVRMRPGPDGRLGISEFYLDGSRSENDITQRQMRQIPLSAIEAFVNSHAETNPLNFSEPGPDLSVFASYFRTLINGYNPDDPNWVVLALISQDQKSREFVNQQGFELRPVAHQRRRWDVVAEDRDFVLASGPTEGLTDDFLRDVKRAYYAALARGERPNVAIAEQTGYKRKSVERWVSKARDRGIMPRVKQGTAG